MVRSSCWRSSADWRSSSGSGTGGPSRLPRDSVADADFQRVVRAAGRDQRDRLQRVMRLASTAMCHRRPVSGCDRYCHPYRVFDDAPRSTSSTSTPRSSTALATARSGWWLTSSPYSTVFEGSRYRSVGHRFRGRLETARRRQIDGLLVRHRRTDDREAAVSGRKRGPDFKQCGFVCCEAPSGSATRTEVSAVSSSVSSVRSSARRRYSADGSLIAPSLVTRGRT